MKWEPVKVSLDENCISGFIRRYHFHENDKKDIIRIYRQILPIVHASFYHIIEVDDKGEKSALVVMSLGPAFDDYQNGLLAKGDIQKAYIADCLGLELMSLAYDEIDKRLFELTGLYAGGYTFVGGDEMPLDELPGIMAKLGQKQVVLNDALVLVPKKSVVFKTTLSKTKQAKHSRCESCNAVNCTLRLSENNKKAPENGEGLIHLYTGDGKGKTTAAIGLAIRAAGAGKKVVFSQFMKGGETSELNVLSKLENIRIVRSDENFGWFRKDDEEQAFLYTKAHNEILDKIEDYINEGLCDVLVMDEVTYPYNWGIINKDRLEKLLTNKPQNMEIVLTGRNADEFFMSHADYITNMEKIRHPYDKGIKARLGIEY